jgi:uncharacterized protein YecE (DUF72 family)
MSERQSHQPRAMYIGTSGWSYPHWKKRFYPTAVSGAGMLEYYAARFRSVEINNTFYRLPERATFAQWRDIVPSGFVFSVKANRYITHMKKLREPKATTADFLSRVGALGERLGPILFQLPPRWRFDAERFEEFLESLPKKFRYAFEFRDRSWFDDRAFDALVEHRAALCIYDLEDCRSPLEITTDLVYVRLHGPGHAYQGKYSTQAITAWARRLSDWRAQGKTVYCYFDNDAEGFAVENALKLQSLV